MECKMSLCFTDEGLLEECIKKLEERAKPSKNDIRYGTYVKYVNCFLSKFGKERVYLVGSTGERSKLAFFKDDGDADFLMVSGKLEISVTSIVQNSNVPCYIWIRADERCRGIGLKTVKDKYLSANTLREVRPELFTVLRAVYLQTTAPVDELPETDEDRTILSVSSKVGLQTTSYRSLQFDIDIEAYKRNNSYVKNAVSGDKRKNRFTERWKSMKIHHQDEKIYRRIYDILKPLIQSNDKRENNGGIATFAQFVAEIITRQNENSECPSNSMSEEDECFCYQNDLKCEDIVTGKAIRATYTETSHKDFVPALVIKGELECMKQWKERVEARGWPLSKVNEIYNTDVFAVARVAPINPNTEKDFCLSFNLAEQKLMESMSKTQRRVFLILKAYLKGVFEHNHRLKGTELRLKTYHIKNLLFWLYESNEENDKQPVQTILQKALGSLREKFCNENLSHYFVPSNNLFIDFEKSDFEMLKECVDEIQKSPVCSLNFYIELNDGRRGEVWFTDDELDCFLDMSADGGRSEHISKLEEAMVDFQRGVNDKRDVDGYAPLQEAILDILEIYLNQEKRVDYSVFKGINDFLTEGQTDPRKLKTSETSKRVEDTANLIVGLGIYIKDIEHLVTKYGGKDGIKRILEGALCGKAVDFNADLGEQIVDTVHRYLNCSDDEEDALSCELKYKLFGYYLCSKEFPDMSGIRRV
ncbi:uncharacterized protein LOC123537109 [Mercenaria mercenaria]|uniref:uncharacterized protein LOC123537109 n=1 Tax=Mercenaria mercenaria TaxID=6596 RepID=UPI00234F777C|nr:uncharacterized protein LOC123537109 [Mercenaria mercenaria]XP_053404190.1 uncharacterized protein LOC123537109 [Mercenaria mercenaria]